MEHSYVYEMRADQPYFFNIIYYDINKENPKADDIAHFHQSLEFVYVAEGTFPVHIQGNTCLLNQGQIAYVQSGQIHYFTTQGDAKVFVLINCGIKAIWNFAPVHLHAPKNILVQNENMATSLAVLSMHLQAQIKDKK